MELLLKAFAKINLSLDVLGKREDGYHEVRMIMQTVGLFDRLTIRDSEQPGIRISTNYSFLPCDESNLCHRAARLLMDEFGIQSGLDIRLEKHIPVAAGLAGGSTDAAAVLKGVNRIFSLGLSGEQLMERGARLGADIPYCLMGGTALSEGIGEKLTPLRDMPECHIVLVKPVVGVSTKFVYENLAPATELSHPDTEGMISSIETGDLEGVARRMSNVLESVAVREYPIIGDIKEELLRLGAAGAIMSGSGSTVFGLFSDGDRAQAAVSELKNRTDELGEGIRQVFVRRPVRGLYD